EDKIHEARHCHDLVLFDAGVHSYGSDIRIGHTSYDCEFVARAISVSFAGVPTARSVLQQVAALSETALRVNLVVPASWVFALDLFHTGDQAPREHSPCCGG